MNFTLLDPGDAARMYRLSTMRYEDVPSLAAICARFVVPMPLTGLPPRVRLLHDPVWARHVNSMPVSCVAHTILKGPPAVHHDLYLHGPNGECDNPKLYPLPIPLPSNAAR